MGNAVGIIKNIFVLRESSTSKKVAEYILKECTGNLTELKFGDNLEMNHLRAVRGHSGSCRI